jgi:hypothetical protein
MAALKAIEELRKILSEAQKSKDSTPAITLNEENAISGKIYQQDPIFDNAAKEPKPAIQEDIASLTADYLTRTKIPETSSIEANRWNDPLRRETNEKFVTMKEMNDHYGLFLQRIQQQMSTIGGGGEVNFRNLDDVDRSTIGPNKHLEYDPITNKFFFEDNIIYDNIIYTGDTTTISISNNEISVINLPNEVIGPIQGIVFDTTHEHDSKDPGTLCWNSDDDTLNIQHTGGVIQQVGQELYARVSNATGSTITSGTVVRFDGVAVNGEAYLEVAPFQANGIYPSLYTLGVATQDIADGAKGVITTWGKVRDINTTGGAENWVLGDILYASPTTAGGLTKVKPTAPNNVVPVAAVLLVSATIGELFVRPTISQQESYGRFARTTDATVAATNTAYALEFNSTEISNGVTIGAPTSILSVDQSGLYQIDINCQVEIAGGNAATGTMYLWIRKNGTDVPNSMRRQGQRGEVPSLSFSYSLVLSLAAEDYIEVMYAADDTNMRFDATAATAFGPTTAAVLIGITQIQL